MALGVAIFATGFNVRASLWELLSNVSRENSYDVQLVFDGPLPREQALGPFAAVPNVLRIEAWVDRMRGRMGRLKGNARVADKVIAHGMMTFALGSRDDLPR